MNCLFSSPPADQSENVWPPMSNPLPRLVAPQGGTVAVRLPRKIRCNTRSVGSLRNSTAEATRKLHRCLVAAVSKSSFCAQPILLLPVLAGPFDYTDGSTPQVHGYPREVCCWSLKDAQSHLMLGELRQRQRSSFTVFENLTRRCQQCSVRVLGNHHFCGSVFFGVVEVIVRKSIIFGEKRWHLAVVSGLISGPEKKISHVVSPPWHDCSGVVTHWLV